MKSTDTRTGDLRLVQELNRKLILDNLRQGEPVSRIDISRRTGLSPSTVSVAIEEFDRLGLIRQMGSGDTGTGMGRRPVLLEFNSDAGKLLTVQVSTGDLHWALLDLAGRITDEGHTSLPEAGKTQAVEDLMQVIEGLVRNQLDSQRLWGIGVATTGLVSEGKVIFAGLMGWEDLPLEDWLRERFSVPICVESDMHVAALGEAESGAGKGCPSLAYVHLDSGVGAGLVLNGDVWRGPDGLAGQLGHISLDDNGAPCYCGNRGCVEPLLGWAKVDSCWTDGRDAFAMAVAQEELVAVALAEQIGRGLGTALVSLVNLVNPSKIILGGQLSRAGGAPLLRAATRVVVERVVHGLGERVAVIPSELGDYATHTGLGVLLLRMIFASDGELVRRMAAGDAW